MSIAIRLLKTELANEQGKAQYVAEQVVMMRNTLAQLEAELIMHNDNIVTLVEAIRLLEG